MCGSLLTDPTLSQRIRHKRTHDSNVVEVSQSDRVDKRILAGFAQIPQTKVIPDCFDDEFRWIKKPWLGALYPVLDQEGISESVDGLNTAPYVKR